MRLTAFLVLALCACTLYAEIGGTFGSSMKPPESGPQTILGAEFTIRRHHWIATDYKIEGERVDLDDVDRDDRTFHYNDAFFTWTFAGLSPRTGMSGAIGVAYLWGNGEVESPTDQKYGLDPGGWEAFLTLAFSWRIVEVFGIDFGASGNGRWVEYGGDADGEYWSYSVSPILSPYIEVEIPPIDGGIKVYAGPLLNWGEAFMDHETDAGLHEEIRLRNRDYFGVYAGAGFTIEFLYIGVRAEFLSELTLKAQAGITF
jgi:hypothetical protein